MSFTLDRERVSRLIADVDRNVRAKGCDHSLRSSAAWAAQAGVNWDDLLDALEASGAYCDCEVVLNLEDAPLVHSPAFQRIDQSNRWLLPPNYTPPATIAVSKVIVSRAGVGKNTHTADGEWLVPAPADAKPRKRVRKIVNFFIGTQTGLPSEVGVVMSIDPIPLARYVHTIADSPAADLQGLDRKVASFVVEKIANLPDGTTVGTDFLERVGISSKHQELTIHRVILRG